jgi:hypothetical protein
VGTFLVAISWEGSREKGRKGEEGENGRTGEEGREKNSPINFWIALNILGCFLIKDCRSGITGPSRFKGSISSLSVKKIIKSPRKDINWRFLSKFFWKKMSAREKMELFFSSPNQYPKEISTYKKIPGKG